MKQTISSERLGMRSVVSSGREEIGIEVAGIEIIETKTEMVKGSTVTTDVTVPKRVKKLFVSVKLFPNCGIIVL
tara:strand:- start:1047 stop:1268 length:222 start_codon:yes stop_codon:yes gene_type:complete